MSDPGVAALVEPDELRATNLAGGVLHAKRCSRAQITSVRARIDSSAAGARCLLTAMSLRKPSAWRARTRAGCCPASHSPEPAPADWRPVNTLGRRLGPKWNLMTIGPAGIRMYGDLQVGASSGTGPGSSATQIDAPTSNWLRSLLNRRLT